RWRGRCGCGRGCWASCRRRPGPNSAPTSGGAATCRGGAWSRSAPQRLKSVEPPRWLREAAARILGESGHHGRRTRTGRGLSPRPRSIREAPMRTLTPALAALLTALVASRSPAGLDPAAAKPPAAKKVDHTQTLHGETLHDDYFWLRDK